MPYFQVMLSGRGIEYPFADGSDPAIGFCTGRMVKAPNIETAHRIAKELVLSEWLTDGTYASGNRHLLLNVDESWQVRALVALFRPNRIGYVFYAHDN